MTTNGMDSNRTQLKIVSATVRNSQKTQRVTSLFDLRLLLSGNFGLRLKFPLSERLSEIASLFGLTLYLDRSLSQKVKSPTLYGRYVIDLCAQ